VAISAVSLIVCSSPEDVHSPIHFREKSRRPVKRVPICFRPHAHAQWVHDTASSASEPGTGTGFGLSQTMLSVQLADNEQNLAHNLYVVGRVEHSFHRRVGRLQPNPVTFQVEPLQSRLFFVL
jgi:hypothetical protein